MWEGGGEFKSRIWTFLRISPAQRLVTLSGLQFSESVKKRAECLEAESEDGASWSRVEGGGG